MVAANWTDTADYKQRYPSACSGARRRYGLCAYVVCVCVAWYGGAIGGSSKSHISGVGTKKGGASKVVGRSVGWLVGVVK